MNTTLLIMAAGIGSRFGTGIKQLEPVAECFGRAGGCVGLCELGWEKKSHKHFIRD